MLIVTHSQILQVFVDICVAPVLDNVIFYFYRVFCIEWKSCINRIKSCGCIIGHFSFIRVYYVTISKYTPSSKHVHRESFLLKLLSEIPAYVEICFSTCECLVKDRVTVAAVIEYKTKLTIA